MRAQQLTRTLSVHAPCLQPAAVPRQHWPPAPSMATATPLPRAPSLLLARSKGAAQKRRPSLAAALNVGASSWDERPQWRICRHSAHALTHPHTRTRVRARARACVRRARTKHAQPPKYTHLGGVHACTPPRCVLACLHVRIEYGCSHAGTPTQAPHACARACAHASVPTGEASARGRKRRWIVRPGVPAGRGQTQRDPTKSLRDPWPQLTGIGPT